MTKLRSFLNEEKKLDGERFAQTLIKIYKDCAPFIRDFIGPQKGKKSLQFLYSGRSISGNPEFIKKRVRKDRKPADIHPLVHDMLDKEFQNKFGYPARSSSLFVTSHIYTASSYGERVYLVFPIGKYKYLWNPEINDLYTHIGDRSGNTVDKNFDNGTGIKNPIVANYVKKNKVFDSDQIKKFRWLYSQKYGNTIIGGNSNGKGYWLYNPDNIKIPKGQLPMGYITKKINKKPSTDDFTWIPDMDYQEYYNNYWEDYMEDYMVELEKQGEDWAQRLIENIVDGYSNKNLKDAVNSQCEIMIHCNEWYGIRRRSDMEDMIMKWIFHNGQKIESEIKLIQWYYDEI